MICPTICSPAWGLVFASNGCARSPRFEKGGSCAEGQYILPPFRGHRTLSEKKSSVCPAEEADAISLHKSDLPQEREAWLNGLRPGMTVAAVCEETGEVRILRIHPYATHTETLRTDVGSFSRETGKRANPFGSKLVMQDSTLHPPTRELQERADVAQERADVASALFELRNLTKELYHYVEAAPGPDTYGPVTAQEVRSILDSLRPIHERFAPAEECDEMLIALYNDKYSELLEKYAKRTP